MKVKICGITDKETALKAVSCGADAIGFVFAESKRKIAPVIAGEISEVIPPSVEKIGVFVNETKEKIEEIINQAKLTMVQLHGDESPEFCQTISVPVIKALGVGQKEDLAKMEQYPCEMVLLDSPKGKYRGGNGTSFNWEFLQGVNISDKKVILAGGLTIENVSQAIRLTNPYMVDVSSGVETDGKKDLGKIEMFIKNAKNAAHKFEEMK